MPGSNETKPAPFVPASLTTSDDARKQIEADLAIAAAYGGPDMDDDDDD